MQCGSQTGAAVHAVLTYHCHSCWGEFLADALKHPEAAAPSESSQSIALEPWSAGVPFLLGRLLVKESLELGLFPAWWGSPVGVSGCTSALCGAARAGRSPGTQAQELLHSGQTDLGWHPRPAICHLALGGCERL